VGKKLIIILCISSLLVVLGYKIKLNSSSEITIEDKGKVISLVNSYYNRMMNKDYQGALQLVDLDKPNYDKDLDTLSNSNYNLKPCLDGDYWVVPVNGSHDNVSYHEQIKCLGVEVAISVTYDNQTYLLNEIVYVKKLGNSFKIVKIDTTDKYILINISYINNIYSNKAQ
jgi:hypothetical protein